MKVQDTFLLPALIGAATAASSAAVYSFQAQPLQQTTIPPTLSPEDARLIFAQRLGASQYHTLGDIDQDTLSYINKFGGYKGGLFEESTQSRIPELVLIVDGVTPAAAEALSGWTSSSPLFYISDPPSSKENLKLVYDLHQQMGVKTDGCSLKDAVNPFNEGCWTGRTSLLHADVGKGAKNTISIETMGDIATKMIDFAKTGEMNIMVVLMPESSKSTKKISSPYGSYVLPPQSQSQSRLNRRQDIEEPLSASSFSKVSQSKNVMASNSTMAPIRGVPKICYPSLDSCVSATNNCSSHGACYQKPISSGDADAGVKCFACACQATVVKTKKSTLTTYWGGAACQKEDVSTQFWLLALFTVVIVGIVSSGIGLMYSIGEEKLPGVIGAGVSNKSR